MPMTAFEWFTSRCEIRHNCDRFYGVWLSILKRGYSLGNDRPWLSVRLTFPSSLSPKEPTRSFLSMITNHNLCYIHFWSSKKVTVLVIASNSGSCLCLTIATLPRLSTGEPREDTVKWIFLQSSLFLLF